MKNNYLRKIAVCFLIAVFTFSMSGCDFFGGSNDNTPEPAVYISQHEINLAVGDTVLLSAVSTAGESITWESIFPAVATVENGLVTAVSKGTTTIMASTPSVMATCTINVSDAPVIGGGETTTESLVITQSGLSLQVGSSVKLDATSSDESAQIIWNSTNTSVATVSSDGTVTARGVGTATITANSGTVIASCVIKVIEVQPSGAEKDGYKIVWYDEFEGNSLDTSKWGYQTGVRDVYHGFDTQNWFWGNNEQQYYTQDAVKVENGSLVITATKQQMDNERSYSSGRILTRDLASWTYGYFEARIKTPTGNGMWPAFWMLPQPSSYSNINNVYGGWPYNGEIDIMEAKGSRMNKVDTTLHYGPVNADTWQSRYDTRETTLKSNTDEWHTYAVEWTSSYIAWVVDGTEVMRVTSDTWYTLSSAATSDSAPFDKPFYILLNLAVGGNYDGGVTPDSSFTSASMYVDYVRVYEKI